MMITISDSAMLKVNNRSSASGGIGITIMPSSASSSSGVPKPTNCIRTAPAWWRSSLFLPGAAAHRDRQLIRELRTSALRSPAHF
jgi:hypothetical protein